MIISHHYETGEYTIIKVDPLNEDYRPNLGDFAVRLGSTTVYMMRDQLLTLMYECETALHRSQEQASE